MHFCVGLVFDTSNPIVELRQEDYSRLKNTRNNLMAALDIEEKLNLMLENYAEFEVELQQLAIRRSLFPIVDWCSSIDDLYTMNRRIANLLSSCRLYIDQVEHTISQVYGATYASELHAMFSTEYDGHLGYRVMEELRNHAQHKDLPIQGLTFHGEHEQRAGTALIKNICIPELGIKSLREDEDFKERILKELEPFGEKIDARPFVRQYVSSIAEVNYALRQKMAGDINGWDSEVRDIINRCRAVRGQDVRGLGLYTRSDNKEVVEFHHIFEDMIKRRDMLRSKNVRLRHLARQYVSNEVLAEKERQ